MTEPVPGRPVAARLARYAAARGRRLEPGPEGTVVVHHGRQRAVCAIEAVGVRGADDALDPIRAAFTAAARRLLPLAGGPAPLIVVLGAPRGTAVLLNDWHVGLALAGEGRPAGAGHVSGAVVVHERAHADDWVDQEEAMLLGEGGAATLEAELRQAVALARAEGRLPAGAYQWVEVFEVRGDDGAPPIPRPLFDGERDQWFGQRPGGRGFGFIGAGRPAGLADGQSATAGDTQSGVIASEP